MVKSEHEIDGDTSRQAIDALLGYAFQLYLTALAWAELKDTELLHVEVAEDFAVQCTRAMKLEAIQVKKNDGVKALTLKSPHVAKTINSLKRLTDENPDFDTIIVFHTTAPIGKERAVKDRIEGMGGLDYWHHVLAGGDVGPLKSRVLELNLDENVLKAIGQMSDDDFLKTIVRKIVWRCGVQEPSAAKQSLYRKFYELGSARGIHEDECEKAANLTIEYLLNTAVNPTNRVLSKTQFEELFRSATSIRVDQQILRNLLDQTVSGGAVDLVDKALTSAIEGFELYRINGEYDATKRAKVLATRIISGDRRGGSSQKKSEALSWCIRILSVAEKEYSAELLAKAKNFEPCIELRIAEILVNNSEKSFEIRAALLELNHTKSFSALTIHVLNQDGPIQALAYLKEIEFPFENLSITAKELLLNHLLNHGEWNEAERIAQQIPAVELDGSAILLSLSALAIIVNTAPESERATLLSGIPFEPEAFYLSDKAEDIEKRIKAIGYFSKASDIYHSIGLSKTGKEQKLYELWLRLRTPDLRDAALVEANQLLKDRAYSIDVVNLVFRFSKSISVEDVEAVIQRDKSIYGKLRPEAVPARISAILALNDDNQRANALNKAKGELLQYVNPLSFLVLETQVLCAAGRKEDAQKVIEKKAGLPDSLLDRLNRIIREADGSDPSQERLEAFKATDSIPDLSLLVEALVIKGDSHELAKYSYLLFQRTGTTEHAAIYVNACDASKQREKVGLFFDEYPGIIAQSHMLAERHYLSLYERGEIQEARAQVEEARVGQDTFNLRILHLSIMQEMADWNGVIEFARTELSQQEDREPGELINLAQLVVHSESKLAEDLTTAATVKSPSDANVMAAAYFTAMSANWTDSEKINSWLNVAVKNSGKDGPMIQKPLKEIVDQEPDWQKFELDIWSKYQNASLNTQVVAQALNRSICSLGLRQSDANRSYKDCRKRSGVPSFHGNRVRDKQFSTESVIIDLSSLLVLADLDLLRELPTLFDHVALPHGSMTLLFEEYRKLKFHQPSQVARATELIQHVGTGVVAALQFPIAPDASLIEEAGTSIATLCCEAKNRNDTSDEKVWVIHPGAVSRVTTLGEEVAKLGKYADVVIGCQPVVSFLLKSGNITQQEYQVAKQSLQLQGDKEIHKGVQIEEGCSLFLDGLAYQYLATSSLIEPLHASGIKIFLLEEEIQRAKYLLDYDARGAVLSKTVSRIQEFVQSGLSSDFVTITKAHLGGETEFDLSTLQIALREAPKHSAYLIDDRAMNKHNHVADKDSNVPIITSLDVIDKLLDGNKIDIRKWTQIRHMLRTGGYLFVPVETDELVYLLNNSAVFEGKLVETAELRGIREYLALVAMSDWFHMDTEGNWMMQIYWSIREAVKEVWVQASQTASTKAKATWLVELFDIRDWIRFRNFEPAEMVNQRANQIWVMSNSPSNLPPTFQSEFYEWVDESLISPIQVQEPEVYRAVLTIVRQYCSELALKLEEEYDTEQA